MYHEKTFLCLAFSFLALSGWAQSPEDATTYAETITRDDLYDHLSILASDALEGRETGERGQKMAAAFISHHFAKLGLQGPVKNSADPYLQKVPFYSNRPGQIWVKAGGKTYTNHQEILYLGSGHTVGEKTSELVFAGKGEEADYAKLNVKDKAVLIQADDWRRYRTLTAQARKQGAAAVFIMASATAADHQKLVEQFKPYTRGGGLRLQKPDLSKDNSAAGTFFISPEAAAAIMGSSPAKLQEAAQEKNRKKLAGIKARPFSFQIEQQITTIESENVLGFLEGSDKKDEVLVITAHYDHIGRQGEHINNGADDDGSGTSAVMELAEAFVKAKQDGKGPRRSILFMLVTAEEKGLLGSEYYASNPIFPLTSTVANLNIDMIGRVDPKHEGNPNYVYLVGANRLSSELHELSERTNATYTQFELDYTYNDENHPDRIYYRSDHWNFAKNGIPVIFYFNGVHDDYHKPTDTIDKIHFEALQKRAQLVFYTAWELANRDNRPLVDKEPAKSNP
ncbi:M28 family peptidase [Cesiribacter andamanensis]|uniref:Arginyl aminopeptidase n=1 Tax=Cesiribacter andamanensis AMV16 TaxID=1279009 RepID=M7NXK0_9BACT|nr:M28 family peptidase [Cesiribacter andamanensis]EMR03134.1 Arginyl aminopeptidase [Cesiribacter andamanensis AMV16]